MHQSWKLKICVGKFTSLKGWGNIVVLEACAIVDSRGLGSLNIVHNGLCSNQPKQEGTDEHE